MVIVLNQKSTLLSSLGVLGTSMDLEGNAVASDETPSGEKKGVEERWREKTEAAKEVSEGLKAER